VSFGESRY